MTPHVTVHELPGRIVRLKDRAHAIRAAEVRLYAEQHQQRARRHAAKAQP